MRVTRLSPAGYSPSPWKNGGGVTIDIAGVRDEGSVAGSWDGVVWRLGRTSITASAPFSDLAGFDRCQVVIAGRGLVLDTPNGEVDLRQPLVPVMYRGEGPIACRLEAGPVEVVNLIGDPGALGGQADVVEVAGLTDIAIDQAQAQIGQAGVDTEDDHAHSIRDRRDRRRKKGSAGKMHG